jgi:hypothetical protein
LRFLRRLAHRAGHAVACPPLVDSIAHERRFDGIVLAEGVGRAGNGNNRVCAGAIVQGMVQQATAIRTMLGRIYTHLSFRQGV